MLELNKIYNVDCLEGVKFLDDESIDLTVTSPPYFNLRDYDGQEKQIGQESDIDSYINVLIGLFDNIYRVTKKTGACWVNIGDVYTNGCLSCIPDKFKIEMIKHGWICRNEIIWHKPNAMPSSAKNRFNNDYEKFFFFAKSDKYYFETQYEPMKTEVVLSKTNKGIDSKYESIEQESSVRQGMNRERGSNIVYIRKNLPEQQLFVNFLRNNITVDSIVENTDIKRSKVEHWFRRDDSGFAYPSVEDWTKIKHLFKTSEEFIEIDKMLTDVTEETDDILKNCELGRVKRAVWSINTKPFKGCHYAPYPEELIETPIIACSPIGGIVLDPFMGSGTTGVVCKKNKRNYIGFELSEKFCETATNRILDETNSLFYMV